MDFDLGFMTLVSVFFKNSSGFYGCCFACSYAVLLVTLHLIQSLSMGKFLLAPPGSCIRLCRFDPFASRVYCKTSTDFCVSSDQDFCISLRAYSHTSFFHWLFQVYCTRDFFHIMIIFKKMQFQKKLGSCLLLLCAGSI